MKSKINPKSNSGFTYPLLAINPVSGNVWLLQTANTGMCVMCKVGSYVIGQRTVGLESTEWCSFNGVITLEND